MYEISSNICLWVINTMVYRYYNGADHYYTKTPGSYSGYSYERTEFNAFLYKAPNTVPVYRYWNDKDHYYSRSSARSAGYVSEGIEFYAY